MRTKYLRGPLLPNVRARLVHDSKSTTTTLPAHNDKQ